MPAQALEQARMALVDLLEIKAAALVHQIDEPEIARGEHDHVVLADAAIAGAVDAPGRLGDRVPDRRVVLIAGRQSRDLPACDRPLDELLEVVAVSLLEG